MNLNVNAGPRSRLPHGFAVTAVSLLAFATLGFTQSAQPVSSSQQDLSPDEQIAAARPPEEVRPGNPVLAPKAATVAVESVTDLKQKLADDDAQLLELATELKSAVDQSNLNTLSVEVIRKAERIQKLAKGYKKKIKLAQGAG